MHRRFLIALALAALAVAQDRSLALRTSVSYNTMKNSAKLSDEVRAEANRLGAEAQKAGLAGEFGEALRHYHHGMALMAGSEWTPSLEFASGVNATLDQSMPEPGQKVAVSLASYYKATRPTDKMPARVVLRPARGESIPERVLAEKQLGPADLPTTISVVLPETEPGDYMLDVRLGESPEKLRSAHVKTKPIHIEALAADAAKLGARIAGQKDSAALATAEYSLALYKRAGEVNPHAYNFRREFTDANALLDALDQGKDPLANKTGDGRRAYRSKETGQLEPYRLFVPASYDGTKAFPMVVALHGMNGNENSMFDGYNGTIKREAERRGFIVAAPKGGDTASMYRGDAEADVLSVVREVRAAYKVDASRIYAMGHSMGGFGSWSIAINHPALFAALGPIAGGGNPDRAASIKHIPQFVVHGDADPTVPVSQSRAMVEAGRKAGAVVEYVEVKGGNHGNIVVPNIAPMFDFFAKQRRAD